MTNNKRALAGCAAEVLVGDHRNEASSNRPTPIKGQLIDRYGHTSIPRPCFSPSTCQSAPS
jgi:hypothetical protein